LCAHVTTYIYKPNGTFISQIFISQFLLAKWYIYKPNFYKPNFYKPNFYEPDIYQSNDIFISQTGIYKPSGNIYQPISGVAGVRTLERVGQALHIKHAGRRANIIS
jgi:hypothetical protein